METPAPANKIGLLDASKNLLRAVATGMEDSVIGGHPEIASVAIVQGALPLLHSTKRAAGSHGSSPLRSNRRGALLTCHVVPRWPPRRTSPTDWSWLSANPQMREADTHETDAVGDR